MKLAIIGAGKIVHDFLPIAKQIPDLTLSAIAGVPADGPELAKLQAQYGIAKTYTDSTQAINDPAVDTVYVAVPNFLHAAICKAALEAKKNVLCEKPFVNSRAEAEALKAIADANHVLLLEAITNQYQENFAGIQRAMTTIGTVRIAEFNYSQYSSRYDAFRAGTVLPAFDPKKDGGALMDLNIYNIHMAVGLFGAPQTVRYTPNIQRGVDTSGVLVLSYPTMTCVCIGAKDCAAPVRSLVEGEDGTIVIDGPTNVLAQFTLQPRQAQTPAQPQRLNRHEHRMVAEFTRFAQIIKTHDQAAADQAFAHSAAVLHVLAQARAQAAAAAK